MSAAATARLLVALGVLPLCASSTSPRSSAHASLPTAAQPDPARFLADARTGTQRYQSQQAAIEDGFTRVGAEFAAMGEHWVSFARVMDDSLAGDRPSILIYLNGTDGPRLAGVAYTTLVTGRDLPPAFPFAGAWHEHSGGVAEESLPIRHSARAHAAAIVGAKSEDEPRVFILHAWVWTPNPDGVFVTDNWGLPFARHGVAPPERQPREAARALALADDHDGYHHRVLRSTLALSGHEDSVAAHVLALHQERARRAERALRATGRLTALESDRLAAVWEALWSDLQAALPGRGSDLRRLRQQM